MSFMMSFFDPTSCMESQVELDKREPTYTNNDCVSGRLILNLDSPVDISQITVTLLGRSISRMEGSSHTECHQLIQEAQQIFPPCGQLDQDTSRFRTLGPKQYTFPFSVAFPTVSGCYKAHSTKSLEKHSQTESALPVRGQETPHLLRRLPPCTGDRSTPAEIAYAVEANIYIGGFLKQSIKQSRQIFFCPTSSPPPPRQSLARHRAVIIRCHQSNNVTTAQEVTAAIATTYHVSIELMCGAYLHLGQRLPIRVQITKVNAADHDLILNDFQAMIVEETEVRAAGQVRVQRVSRILRTVSNLRMFVCLAETPVGTAVNIPDDFWGGQLLPTAITPTFETCNVRRSYKLEVRLGFNSRPSKVQTRILEVHFPVHIVATEPAPIPSSVPRFSDKQQDNIGDCIPWQGMTQ
ncbi:hypothetical protein BO82DRAFT_406608 [Aspergillus uvarum CBS 121591]|uniref:Arrestin-like N-terminal domain-containing protein n=1 Tax=Aspergillus uvarum CBS 121591 TaxID=1448315 RepID=A0A319BZS8_9EURO|nr:hypothetical protein BO82DRAFT_406608 [Aspergillus uvarum CBS 121591]PYH76999.1 hypothetical protein BO82DRAFT_406608 [Aspergillus uvarum CBS 121591]